MTMKIMTSRNGIQDNKFNKVYSPSRIMSKKNHWVRDVEIMLRTQAMSSTEIAFRLKSKYRHSPHARKVTLVLRGLRSEFKEMNKVSVSSSLSRESHQVCLWGLRGYKYEESHPHLSVGA